MAQRPPRACYIPQQIPQRGPPVYRNHKGTAYPDPAGKGHDRSYEHHSHQNRNAPDYNNIMQALTMIQNNMKTMAYKYYLIKHLYRIGYSYLLL
jgi:hypothetical protein